MTRKVATFTVLVTPAHDLPGQWVAHCLNIDLVSQGDSISHAMMMAREAILEVVADDFAQGLDPLDRAPAEAEYWDMVSKVMREARPLTSIPDDQQDNIVAVVAAVMVVLPVEAMPGRNAPEPEPGGVLPPAWQIAALEDMRNAGAQA